MRDLPDTGNSFTNTLVVQHPNPIRVDPSLRIRFVQDDIEYLNASIASLRSDIDILNT